MDGQDRDKEAPSLEPPSLFGRRGRRKEARPAEPVVVEPALEPAPQPISEPVPAPVPSPAPPAFADQVPVEEDPAAVAAAEEPMTTAAPQRPRRRLRAVHERRVRAPRTISGVNGMVAACVAGLVVGLGTVLLTWASLGVCEVATGTTSCGDPGFFLLVAVLVAMTLLGSAMLRLFGVADPGSTSFLAVGLLAVLILLFLVDVLFSWTMVVVIPLLAVATYALSHWVTTTFAETD